MEKDPNLRTFYRLQKTEKDRPRSPGVILFEYLEALVGAAVIVLLLCTFVFRMVMVDGSSMLPTLWDRDFLVSTHVMYEPERGDIVVITQPNDVAIPLIKRIVAKEGDTLDIDFEQGEVILNGEVLTEEYINELTYYQPMDSMEFPLTVPEGMVFAMGDNRNNSSDSRDARIGLIDERYIMGKTIFRLFPIGEMGLIS